MKVVNLKNRLSSQSEKVPDDESKSKSKKNPMLAKNHQKFAESLPIRIIVNKSFYMLYSNFTEVFSNPPNGSMGRHGS